MNDINKYVKIALYYRGDKADNVEYVKIKNDGRNLGAILIESEEVRSELPEYPSKLNIPKKQVINF